MSRTFLQLHIDPSGQNLATVAIFVHVGNFSAKIIVFRLRTALTGSHSGTTVSRPFQVPGARPCTQGVVVYLKLQTTNKDLDALFDIDFFVCVVSSVSCDVAVFA